MEPAAEVTLGPRAEALRKRLAAAEESEDPAWLGTAEALGDIEALQRELVGSQSGLVIEAAVLGLAYWYRFLASRGTDECALGGAAFFLWPVHAQAKALVPEPVAEIFGALGPEPAFDPAVARDVAAGLTAFYVRHRYPGLLRDAEGLLRRAAAGLRADDPGGGTCRSSLGIVLWVRASLESDPALLREAAEQGRTSVAAMAAAPPDQPERARRLGNLGRVLITLGGRTHDRAVILEGTALTRQALELAGPGTIEQASWTGNLGDAGFLLATEFDDLDALPEATESLRQALRTLPEGHPDRAERLFSLGMCQAMSAMTPSDQAPSDQAPSYRPSAARLAAFQDGVARIAEAMAAAPVDADRLRYLVMLAYLRFGWGLHARDSASHEQAESEARQVLRALPESHALHAQALFVIGEVQGARFDLTGDPRHLTAAIATERQVVRLTPPDRDNRLSRVAGLCSSLRTLAREGGDREAAAEAVRIARDALAEAPAGSDDRARILRELGGALVLAGPAHAGEGIQCLRECLNLPAPDRRFPARLRWDLGLALLEQDPLKQDPLKQDPDEDEQDRDEDWDEGTGLLREAIRGLATDDGLLPEYRSSLGLILWQRAEGNGSEAMAGEALALAREAVASAAPGTAQEAACRSNLGAVLIKLGRQAGSMSLMEEGVGSHRAAVAVTGAGDAHRPGRLGNLADGLRALSELTSDTARLDEAIQVARDAVAAAPPGHPQRHQVLLQLGICLRTRSDLQDAPQFLAEAATVLREALALAETEGKPAFSARHSLINTLSDLAVRTRDEAIRDEAMGLAESELSERSWSGRSGEERALMLLSLGLLRWRKAADTGDDALLEAAIGVLREAAAALPVPSTGSTGVLMNLGGALLERSQSTGDAAWSLEAVGVLRRALAACPPREARRAGILSNLSSALRHAYEQTDDQAFLDEAAERAAEATSLGFGLRDSRAYAQVNLAAAQQIQALARDDPGLAERATQTLEAGLEDIAADHPMRAKILADLAGLYWIRVLIDGGALALLTGEPDRTRRSQHAGLLRRAAAVAREALTRTEGRDAHPERARAQWLLADIEFRRAQLGERASLAEAARLADAAASSSAASMVVRTWAARVGADATAAMGLTTEALSGYARAVDLLGRVAPRSLSRAAQEGQLSAVVGLASDAAAIALAAGDPERALALLEQGRGILLAQGMDARGDLSRLRELDPGLAAEFERLRDTLSTDATLTGPVAGPVAGPGSGPAAETAAAAQTAAAAETATRAAQVAEARHALARSWDPLVERIRSLEGMSGFLRPPAGHELRAAAAGGPVVVVNVSRYRCDAILVTVGGIDVVGLPGLTPGDVLRRTAVNGLLVDAAYGQAGPDAIPAAARALSQTLEWLWDVIADPVLDRLGLRSTPDDGQPWPRVFWCPTGWLSFLPLHAAGRHREGAGRTVLDRAISSYTPTLRALIRARSQLAGALDLAPGPLVVALPETPGGHSLPGAAREAEVIGRIFPARTELAGPGATVAAVRAALPRHSWVHFGCHGVMDPARPSAAGLQLHDGRLRVLDIAALRPDRPVLAMLAACSTSQGTLGVPDEAIHLASSFQLAGYPHVAGTLWPLSDRLSTQLTEEFYAGLADMVAAGQRLDPAAALHFPVRALRDRLSHAPHLWAAYTHAGP